MNDFQSEWIITPVGHADKRNGTTVTLVRRPARRPGHRSGAAANFGRGSPTNAQGSPAMADDPSLTSAGTTTRDTADLIGLAWATARRDREHIGLADVTAAATAGAGEPSQRRRVCRVAGHAQR